MHQAPIDRRRALGLLAASGALASPLAALAQAGYPNKPINLIVGFAPGGSADITARLFAERLRVELGQPVIVENRPGAGGNIGADVVVRAPKDGYTLLLAAAAQIVINPSLYKSMTFNPAKDLAPITQLQVEHNLMVVGPAVPVKTLTEFIAYAKAHPNEITFASPGNGSPAHLAGELLNQRAGLKMQHVPYKGTGPAITDLIAGNVTMAIDNMPALLPQVKSGKLRALAVASDKRAAAAPEIPTMAEAGMKGYVVMAWKGLMAPAGTPAPIIARLHDAAVKVIAMPDMREKMISLGAEPVGSTPAQFAETIQRETQSWAALIKSTGTTIE
ncbi:MAG: tripartite tricarboxylate transporter substrate binding protein [Pseudomonadota bacterium]|nr:tripartite tricarboxylate transporter substrate binding protein [Pseudomonadota bacterium]